MPRESRRRRRERASEIDPKQILVSCSLTGGNTLHHGDPWHRFRGAQSINRGNGPGDDVRSVIRLSFKDERRLQHPSLVPVQPTSGIRDRHMRDEPPRIDIEAQGRSAPAQRNAQPPDPLVNDPARIGGLYPDDPGTPDRRKRPDTPDREGRQVRRPARFHTGTPDAPQRCYTIVKDRPDLICCPSIDLADNHRRDVHLLRRYGTEDRGRCPSDPLEEVPLNTNAPVTCCICQVKCDKQLHPVGSTGVSIAVSILPLRTYRNVPHVADRNLGFVTHNTGGSPERQQGRLYMVMCNDPALSVPPRDKPRLFW